MLFLWLAIYSFQCRHWTLGCMAFSWGLGIKMSLLLVLPAVLIILFLGRGLQGTINLTWLMIQIQLAIGVPFFAKNWRGYFGRAFELSRQFKFEWTVNWRMMGEEYFLSRSFALTLLGVHAALLLIFIIARWLQPAEKPLLEMVQAVLRLQSPFTKPEQMRVTERVTPRYVMTTMLTANLIGLLCARSLHYQFYAYLAWATPYLLWYGSPSALFIAPLWCAQEWAWNVFPSTDASSVVVVNVMAIIMLMVYFGTDKDEAFAAPKLDKQAKNK